jgi:protein-tyrosine phosphatase
MTLRVLTVCTGNICRSPFAAQLLADRLRRAGVDAEVESAGVRAMVDSPMTPEAAEMSHRHGVDPSAHLGRQLTPAMLEQADLVLTASRNQRAEVVRMLPRASRRTFTLREFERVAAYLAADAAAGAPLPEDPAALVEEFAAVRGFAERPATPEHDDIVDPYRRPPEVYAEAERLIARTVDAVVQTFARTLRGGARAV